MTLRSRLACFFAIAWPLACITGSLAQRMDPLSAWLFTGSFTLAAMVLWIAVKHSCERSDR